MQEPFFLTEADVLMIHLDQMSRYGGLHGLRDLGLLQSALAQPQATFAGQYLHPDLFQMAAAYAFHLVRDHPFRDGNKRVAAMAAFTFLYLNGLDLQAPEAEFEKLILQAASGVLAKADLVEFFNKYSVPLND